MWCPSSPLYGLDLYLPSVPLSVAAWYVLDMSRWFYPQGIQARCLQIFFKGWLIAFFGFRWSFFCGRLLGRYGSWLSPCIFKPICQRLFLRVLSKIQQTIYSTVTISIRKSGNVTAIIPCATIIMVPLLYCAVCLQILNCFDCVLYHSKALFFSVYRHVFLWFFVNKTPV